MNPLESQGYIDPNGYNSYAGETAFVTEIKAGGSALVYSTYLGGLGGQGAQLVDGNDSGQAIAVDGAGRAYVTGFTSSAAFPTMNACQSTLKGRQNAFLTEFKAGGEALVYSTFLGGSTTDAAYGIALGPAGEATIVGLAQSPDFPTLQDLHLGGTAFIARFQAGGASLLYSTLLGGKQANAVALDSSGDSYVTGNTGPGLPTVNAIQSSFGGGSFNPDLDAFVSELKADGSALVYSTYLGGSGDDSGEGIGLDALGNAYIVGTTSSLNFPTVDPIQSRRSDVFIAEIGPSGSLLVYSGYSPFSDGATGIAVDANGEAYVVGSYASLAKIGAEYTAPPTFTPPAGTYSSGQMITISDSNPDAKIYYTTVYGAKPTTSSTLYTGPFAMDGAGSVSAIATAPDVTVSPVVNAYYAFRVAEPTVTAVAGRFNQTETVTITDITPGATIHYTLNGTTPTSASPLYTAPIQVTTAETMSAIGILSGYENSTVNKQFYSPPAAEPILTPAAGYYAGARMVTITDATPGAKIYYTTTHGATPTTSSIPYTGPFLVDTAGTVSAIAVASGYANSAVASAYYDFRIAPVTVTLSEASPGTIIYYTLDGSAPTANSARYTGPITVSGTQSVRAIALPIPK